LPDLFSLARCKDASMVDLSEFSSNSYEWNVSFLKAAHTGRSISLPCSSIFYTSLD